MNINDPADPLLPDPENGHHRSARERQRKGPMWGCTKAMLVGLAAVAVLLVILIGGGWWYVGTTSFADLVRLRIEQTLESRLGREVTIGSVEIVRTQPQKIILNDLRIANAPGGAAPLFAHVRQVEITGGIDSFWRRSVRVGRVDIRDPRIWFEIFPEGAQLVHNFPKWRTGPRRRYEIVRLQLGQMFIANGEFSYLDRRRDMAAVATQIASTITITRAEDLYAGIMTSPSVRVRLQQYEPFELTMRGGFRYTPGTLALQSIALNGRGIEAFVSGKLDPLTEAAYDLKLASRFDLERVREIFRIEQELDGSIVLDGQLRGRAGDFALTGGWAAPAVTAAGYELTNAKGTLNVTDENLVVKVQQAGYGGGTIAADYALAQYGEPYPMKVALRYDRISIEQLFSNWGVENTGLRGAATGTLAYRWNKDAILAGSGEGSARLAPNATAFSRARYPIPLSGSTDFTLNNGVVTFRRADLATPASRIALSGSLRIEEIVTNLQMTIRSSDFSELDRIAYNFAHAAGNTDYDLLGLGGAGTITGSVRGPIARPDVAASIAATNAQYNEVLLGDANISLRYDGNRSVLTFDPAVFTLAGGRLVLNGTIAFPDRGAGPVFDLAVESSGYPAQRAIEAVGLDLEIGSGLATGRMLVAGTPENGRATFAGLTIRRADATLTLDGTVNWLPGEGNVAFDLQIAASDFPVEDIASFLDFADIPLTGELTGTLRLAGRKEALEGEGEVAIRRGTIFGEPVQEATAQIEFTRGRLRATDVIARSEAGEIRGQAEIDLGTQQFSYTIESATIDVSRLQLAAGLRDLLGGNVVIRSTGAGTFEDPELVIEATLEQATLRGLDLPEGTPPPSLYIAIRGGRLIVRGSIADVVSIEGEGVVGENLAVDALVRVTVTDLGRALALFPTAAGVPVAGNLVVDLRLGGRLSSLEDLVVDATAPVFNLRIAEQEFVAPEPLRMTLRDGRLTFDSVALAGLDSIFTVTGSAGLAGSDRTIDVDVRGRIEAALLQLFMQDVRAEGHLDLAVSIDGTMDDPAVVGFADVVGARVKFAGFPQLIDEINGRLRFRGDRIQIESLRATVGGGTIVAGGFVTLDGTTPQSARITLQGTNVSIRYYEGVTFEGNFALLLTGDAERGLLQGEIDVTRALYYRDFDVQQTLLNVLLARDRVTVVSDATWQDRISLRIDLDAPGTLAIDNNIAEVTGSAELDVTGTVANPVIVGEVTLDEGGTVRIQNIDYRVVRGTIAFQNPFRIDPFFDVTIEGTASGMTADLDAGPLQITVNLTGTLDRLIPSITSDPPASDITLFSILGFGGLGNREATQQAGGVGMLGQSLLYQSLSGLIGSRVFPFVDTFSYDPGNLEAGSGAGAKVTFEKRLSNRIRFLLVYNLDQNTSRQVVEWLVNENWTMQLARDESDEYRLDARFRRRYDAHWTIGRGDEEDFATAAVMTRADAAGGALPLAPLPAATDVEPGAVADQTIAQINFRADAPFNTAALAEEVTLAPGEVVTIRELQSSIKNLFATGNFRDIRVDATSGDEGAVVTFLLYLHYRVGDVDVTGLARPERVRARRELRVRAGEILSLDAVDDTAAAIEEMLRRRGFLEATVDPQTNFDRERSIAEVTFEATPGPRAMVRNVILEGNPAPFTTEQLIARMRRRPGRTFNLREARQDAERMQEYLVRNQHRRAEVVFEDYTYDEATESVTVRYRVDAGPVVRVAVAGVPRRTVRRWIPFERGQEYSEDLIDRAADRIVQELQLRGHYRAAVDTESTLESNVWTTTFHVDPGPRYRLADVRFSGNGQLADEQLDDVVETTPGGGFRRMLQTLFRRRSGVTRQQLADDRDALEAYYRLQGFSEATVGTPAVQTRADGTMIVEFPITEGPQTIVSDLRVEGNVEFDAAALPASQLAPGQPLNPQSLQQDVVALQTFYADRGHVEVQVVPRVATSDDRTSATVAYVIAEGPQVNIDEVIVRGNTYTDRDVVLRTAGLEQGDPFSYISLLEAQRDLYRLGSFQRVEVQSHQSGTSLTDRDVVIQIEEGRNLTLAGSVGLRAERDQTIGGGTTIQERVAVAAAHRNLFGTGRYLGIEGVFSRDEQEAFLTYREPFISRWNVPVQFQIFQSDDNTRPGAHILQRGASIEALKVARAQTRWSLRYEYKISECQSGELCISIDQGLPVEGLDRSLLDIQISSITPTFFWDRRDDIIDPRRGFFTSASLEYAFPFLSAEAHFLKSFVQGAWYLPVTARSVFVLAGRTGVINPATDATTNPVPLSERFTAGGETTHRAFGLDRLGTLCLDPRDFHGDPPRCRPTLFRPQGGRVLPLGGNSMLLFNAEYRFPIVGTLGGAVFSDVGNVYAGETIRWENLRYGVGAGLRYLSPVGPLRFDVGFPLERRIIGFNDDGTPQREGIQYFITLGYPF